MDPPPPSFQTHRFGTAANRLATPSIISGVPIRRDRRLQAIHSICGPLQQHEHDGLLGPSNASRQFASDMPGGLAWPGLRFPAVGGWTAHDGRRSRRRANAMCCSPLLNWSLGAGYPDRMVGQGFVQTPDTNQASALLQFRFREPPSFSAGRGTVSHKPCRPSQVETLAYHGLSSSRTRQAFRWKDGLGPIGQKSRKKRAKAAARSSASPCSRRGRRKGEDSDCEEGSTRARVSQGSEGDPGRNAVPLVWSSLVWLFVR